MADKTGHSSVPSRTRTLGDDATRSDIPCNLSPDPAAVTLPHWAINPSICAVFMTYDFKLDNLTRKRRKVR